MELVLYLHGFLLGLIGDDRTLCHTVNDFPFDITLGGADDKPVWFVGIVALGCHRFISEVSGAGHDKVYPARISTSPGQVGIAFITFKVGVFGTGSKYNYSAHQRVQLVLSIDIDTVITTNFRICLGWVVCNRHN